MQALVEQTTSSSNPAPKSRGSTMRAIVHREYGTPDVLRHEEIARPVPGDDDVLVRVHAAGASIGDHHIITGLPYVIRLSPFAGVRRPKNLVPGSCLAGVVEAVGANVTTFRAGDEVFGQPIAGAFAEYAVVPASRLARKPRNLSFAEAALVPWAVAPLQALRETAGLKAGQRVLINGASGGVGTWAVQIAKAMGADVTAVCSTRNVEKVRALGADEVIDYTKEDFVSGGPRFDVVFDTVASRWMGAFRSVLLPTGSFVSCGGGNSSIRWLARMGWAYLNSLFTTQKLTTFIVNDDGRDLPDLKELVESGNLKPLIDRRYPLNQVADALRHVGGGHAQGQTVIEIRD